MKPVEQVHFGAWDAIERGEVPGDCMRACVASIFELALEDVPHFVDTGPRRDHNATIWWYAWQGWALDQGALIYRIEVHDRDALASSALLPGYSLLSGISPRAEPGTKSMRHVCVGFDGEIVWDPHPSDDGLRTIDEADYLVPITAAARELLARAPNLERADV